MNDRLCARLPRRLRATWHGRCARLLGLDRPYLILSFDCDTDRDAEVAVDVHTRLAALDVEPVYAVPGELLVRGSEAYGWLADEGAEFINHGHTEHTYFDEERGRHASCFFYDRLSRTTVRGDIVAGDRTVAEVVGRRSAGFRTPHFGTFQAEEDLAFLHGVLGELGYSFSSSTTPDKALRHGPAYRPSGVLELPVTGFASAPLEVYDTWSCFEAPDRVRTPDEYVDEAERLAQDAQRAGAALLNVYGDPSHVHGREEFFEAIEHLRRIATPITYGRLLEIVR